MEEKYTFRHLSDVFKFGKHRGRTLSDVLDFDSTYILWCQKEIEDFLLTDTVLDEIRSVYPDVILNYSEEEILGQSYSSDIFCPDEDYDEDDSSTYQRYNGTWAQDEFGYSDDDIDTIFDGNPEACWNID